MGFAYGSGSSCWYWRFSCIGSLMPRKKVNKAKVKKSTAFRRSLFYSVCIFALYQFIVIPLQKGMYDVFWTVSIGGTLVVLVELFYSRIADYKKPFAKGVVHARRKLFRRHFIHHFVLPFLLYISGVFFLFFNRMRLMDQVAIVILTGGFLVLFFNISSTYMKMYSISRSTRYVFDFINIVIFYFINNVLVNLVFYEGWTRLIIYLGTAFFAIVLIGLMVVISKQVSRSTTIALVITAFVMGLSALIILLVPLFNIAVLSLVITIVFYLAVAFWHHKLDGSFSWDTMFQYILFAVMAVILLLYL